MSTCKFQLDLESLLGSWPTIYICPKISSRALVGGEELGIDDGSGIPKGPPCHRLSYSMSGSYPSTLKTKREDKSFENRPSIIGDSVLAAPTQMTEYCPSRREYCRALHIYFFLLFHPKRCGLHAFGSSHVSRGTFWHWNALVQKLPSEFTVMLLMHLHFADQFFLRQLSFFMFGGQDGAYSTPFSWGEIRPPLR